MTEIIDITRTLGDNHLTWPGDVAFATEDRSYDDITVHTLRLSSHSGTHLDAPRHFLTHGTTLDQMPVSRFILQAQVLQIDKPGDLSAEMLIEAGYHANRGEALLLKTTNRHLSRAEFSDSFIGLLPSAAQWLVRKQIGLVGIDYLSIENSVDESYPVHRSLLSNGVLILEDIDLSGVDPGRYQLIVLPMKWKLADGAPARAVLIRNSEQ